VSNSRNLAEVAAFIFSGGDTTMATQRNQFYKFRMNEAEVLALERLAEHEQRKTAETLRELIRVAARRAGLWPAHEETGREAAT